MTTKRQPKQQTAKTAPTASTWKGFVNIELPSKAKGELIDLENPAAEAIGVIEELADNQFKLSIYQNPMDGVFSATATCNDPESSGYGYAVSARSLTLTMAILAVGYKVIQVAQYELGNHIKPNSASVDL